MPLHFAERHSLPRAYELDLLRLAAALMVVAAHYLSASTSKLRSNLVLGAIFDWGDPVARLAQFGELGVDVFFIISGYVIALSASERNARGFAAARVARVVPAFWFCCGLTTLLILLDPAYRSLSLSQVVANLFFVARPLGFEFVDGVYWSLVVEMRFYLLVAAVIWWRGARALPMFLLGWLALAWLDVRGLVPAPLRFVAVPQYAPFFICGGAIRLMSRPSDRRLGAFLWLAAMLVLCLKAPSRLPWQFSGQAIAIVLVYAAASAVLLGSATNRMNRWGRPWMWTLGALTYPLYLLHQDIGYLWMRHFPATGIGWVDHRAAITLACVASMLLLSHLVVRWVERPLAPRLKAWLHGRSTRTRPVPEQSHA